MARTVAQGFIQPKGRRPLKRTAQLSYTNTAELRAQLTTFARSEWLSAKQIRIDVTTQEIIADGVPVANYRIHEPAKAAGPKTKRTLL